MAGGAGVIAGNSTLGLPYCTCNPRKPEPSSQASLVVKPTSIAPATFLIHIGGVLLLLFEIVLPANDIVFVVRIVYMFMWNVVIFLLRQGC